MNIDIKLIKSLNPCTDSLDNAIKHYSNKTVTPRQFMGLKHISHKNKIWVAFRLMPKDKIRFAAADIAESVLHIFEAEYPNDDRPRKAIEAARGNDKKAAASAATDAFAATATSANTTASASWAAAAAAFASSAYYESAFAASAPYAAYAATGYDSSDRSTQEKLIRTIILRYWK